MIFVGCKQTSHHCGLRKNCGFTYIDDTLPFDEVGLVIFPMKLMLFINGHLYAYLFGLYNDSVSRVVL